MLKKMGDIIVKFSDNFKDLMQERGVNIRSLSQELEIDDSSLYDYLYGALPSIEYAVRLANYFDCSLNFLMGVDDEPKLFAFNNSYDIGVFINRYNALLETNNTTHFKVSKICGVNYSSHYAWVRGSIPAMSSLIIISRYFDVSIDYLVGRSDVM